MAAPVRALYNAARRADAAIVREAYMADACIITLCAAFVLGTGLYIWWINSQKRE